MRREGCLFSGGTREEGAIYLIRLHDVSPCSINTINGDRGGKREETTLGEDISLTRHLQTFFGESFLHGGGGVGGQGVFFPRNCQYSMADRFFPSVHLLFTCAPQHTHPANRRNDSFTHSRISVSRARMGGCA